MISSLTATYAGGGICSSIDSVCGIGGSLTRDCKQSYTASALSSCLCQSSLLSAASVCEYVGNQTCLLKPATLSSVDLFILCPVNMSLIFPPPLLYAWVCLNCILIDSCIFRTKHQHS